MYSIYVLFHVYKILKMVKMCKCGLTLSQLCCNCRISLPPQCLQYKTDQAQDVKKIEKLHGKLMRLMVSKETHSGAMETD